MDQFGRLGSVLLIFLVISQLLKQCASQLIVNIEVSGEYVVKTGIRTYTTRSYGENYVTIRCSAPVSVPSNVSLFKGKREIATSEIDTLFVEETVNDPGGKYYCVLNTTIRVSNDSCYNVSVWSETEIKTEWKWPVCASSIGNLAYNGEKAVLKCTGSSYDCSWDNEGANVIEEVIEENTVRTCTCCYTSCYNSQCHGCYRTQCPLSISVVQSIHLNLYISANVANSNSSVIEFLCFSKPSRLMNWEVIGIHGDILDLDNLNQSMNVNTLVYISQSPGETYLRIWEAIPGGNGIHTVVCSAYDTEKRVVAFRRMTTPSECSFDCRGTSFKTTDMQETTSTSPTTTDASTTSVVTTTEEAKISKVFDMASTEQDYELEKDAINDYVLIGFASLPYLVIIFILIGIICYMHYRHKNKMEISTEDQTPHTSLPETVLHDNPAYLSFSETKDYITKKEDEENELTYVNL